MKDRSIRSAIGLKISFCFLGFFFFLLPACSGQLLIASASDLQFAMPELAKKFQQETGVTVKFTFGSSGNFTNQIKNGAPFDMFFSADLQYPRQLEQAGMVEPGSFYHYANGKIVFWVSKASTIDLHKGLAVLLKADIHKLAIANPEHAPYGKAAVSALKTEQLYEAVKDKLVLGENISQTLQFAESGSADAAIVALSLVAAPDVRDKGRYTEISTKDYPAIEQGCVILKASSNKQAAQQFLAFLKKPEATELLARFGLDPVKIQ